MSKNLTIKTEEIIESTNTSIFSKIKTWLKKNPAEFYVLAILTTSLIYGLVLALYDMSLSDLFVRFHLMHTTFSNEPIAIFGFGLTIFNASVVGFFFYFWGKITRIRWTGVAFMSIIITYGFSFYIHNFYAILFLMLGILLSSIITKQSLDKYYSAFTLSAATVQVFALLAFGSNSNFTWRIEGVSVYGTLVGGAFMIFVGLVAQKVGALVAKVNDGITLANTGVSHGFLTVFIYAVMLMFGMFITTGKDNANVYLQVTGQAWEEGKNWAEVVSWLYIPYISALSTVLLIFAWFFYEKGQGILDVFKRDGKAPTDYFEVSGTRETYFTTWGIIHFMIFLEGIWVWQTGKDFGFNSDNHVAFIQAISFAPWGGHLTGAFLLTIGFYIAYYATLAGAGGFSNDGEWVGGYANKPWSAYTFPSLVYFGWLLIPLVTINWLAPIFGGILHATIHRMFGVTHGGLFMFNHGFSTFMSVLIMQAFFTAINWVRTHRTKGQTISEDLEQDKEKMKSVAMSSELMYFLLDNGAKSIGTTFEFSKRTTIIKAQMKGAKKKVLEDVAKNMNKIKRDPITEFTLWPTLGTDPNTRNMDLLASMVDDAKVEVKGQFSFLIMKRKLIDEQKIVNKLNNKK